MQFSYKLLISIIVSFIILHIIVLTLVILPYEPRSKLTYILYTKPAPAVQSEAGQKEYLQPLFDTWFGDLGNLSGQQKENYLYFLFNEKVHYSVTRHPRWEKQYTHQENLQDVMREMGETPNNARFSYQLSNGYWYNYRTIETRPLAGLYSSILLAVEFIILGIIIFHLRSTLRFTIPLTDFKVFAKQIGNDLNTKVPTTLKKGPRAIREIGSAIHEMQIHIQDLVHTRTNMLTAISHDLRTPITRLKLRTQFIEDKTIVKKILQDLDEMESMIDGILYFARNDVVKEKKKPFDLGALVASCCDEFTDLNYNVFCKIPPKELVVFGIVSCMKRVINNIIGNAIKYATQISVELTYLDKQAIITIEDDGPGIPEKEMKKVFTPFYRGNARRCIGAGLGLAISKEIIQKHKGTIELSNVKPNGLAVKIILPTIQFLSSDVV